MEKMSKEYIKCLKKYYGYDGFRENQREVLEALVENKRDVFCCMATGSGKSICYQLPALLTNKVSVVVSPLISLMEDQQLGLDKRGIKSCCYNSNVGDKQTMAKDIVNGVYSVVYITPETIINCRGLLTAINENAGMALIAIDESHCISMWGNSFRPSYKSLKCLKEWFPEVPLMALTGTATFKVQNDIIEELGLKDALVIRGTSNRPNLFYEVRLKSNPEDDLASCVNADESVIVYCRKRAETQQLANLLNEKGFKAEAYHAGLTNTKRSEIHEKFMNDKIKCIVATISFGMGIDKPDIRQVIHYGSPKDIESYVQEIGRAGRDGQDSECIMFYKQQDIFMNKFHLKDMNDGPLKTAKLKMIQEMEKYIHTHSCRRRFLLDYFSEKLAHVHKRCCDNCKGGHKKTIDVTVEAQHILNLVFIIDKIYGRNYGKNMYINILYGRQLKNIPDIYKQIEYYGICKKFGNNNLKALVLDLIHNGYLSEKYIKGCRGATIYLTEKGKQFLKTQEKHFIVQTSPAKKHKKTQKTSTGLSNTIQSTLDLFNKGFSLDKICQERSLKKSTIEGHLAKIIEHGHQLDIDRLNFNIHTYHHVNDILKQFKQTPSLKELKNNCDKNTTYADIKYTLAFNKSGLTPK